MGLLGAYSDHEIQGRLRQLSEKLDQVAASDTKPHRSGRSDRRLRSGLIPKAIMRVLTDPVQPMQVCDIHAAVEDVLGQSVSLGSVKSWLCKHSHGERPLFVRLERGRYGLATTRPVV